MAATVTIPKYRTVDNMPTLFWVTVYEYDTKINQYIPIGTFRSKSQANDYIKKLEETA